MGTGNCSSVLSVWFTVFLCSPQLVLSTAAWEIPEDLDVVAVEGELWGEISPRIYSIPQGAL